MSRVGKMPIVVPQGRRRHGRRRDDQRQGRARHAGAAGASARLGQEGRRQADVRPGERLARGRRDVRNDARAGRQHGRRRHEGLREEAHPGRRRLPGPGPARSSTCRSASRTRSSKDMPAGVKVETPSQTEIVIKGVRAPGRRPGRCRGARVAPARALQGQGHPLWRRKGDDQGNEEEVRRRHADKKDQRLRRSKQTRVRIALAARRAPDGAPTNLHIYASRHLRRRQRVLASASTAEADVRKELGESKALARAATSPRRLVGKRIAEKAKAAGIEKVAFDRAGFALRRPRQGAGRGGREAGLQF